VAGARIPIKGGQPGPLEVGGQLEGNPGHPKAYTRISNYFRPFKPTRLFFDPDGGAIGVASTCLQQCHQSWSGAGGWYLFGNQPMKGRRWDEPFPSNQHYLSAMSCGDICRGAKTDRYLVGSGATGMIVFADLRSGGGKVVVPEALSFIHDSPNYMYSGSSALFDNDAKGSPDGTKICFVSTYDLKDGPIARITTASSAKTGPGIHVDSTAGFPESGRLSIRDEVMGYERKTAVTFEGLTRGLYSTGRPHFRKLPEEKLQKISEHPSDLKAGWVVTSFDARLIPEAQREQMAVPPRFAHKKFADAGSPLMWQRRTDVYIAVARKPDRPWLRQTAAGAQLVPGELHFETRGYRILRDGQPMVDNLLAPGARLELPGDGEYAAVAVEHSGLASVPSNAVRLQDAAVLTALAEAPQDFSWTRDRWLVDGQETDEQAAKAAPKATREILHRYDGVIHREWWVKGALVRRHDLDLDGKPIRRLFYEAGRLTRREYHSAAGEHVTTELFDADGYITESVHNRNGREWNHWWYVKGTPVKLKTERGGHHTASPARGGVYIKQGIEWVKVE